jgi:hypothetical protein
VPKKSFIIFFCEATIAISVIASMMGDGDTTEEFNLIKLFFTSSLTLRTNKLERLPLP